MDVEESLLEGVEEARGLLVSTRDGRSARVTAEYKSVLAMPFMETFTHMLFVRKS